MSRSQWYRFILLALTGGPHLSRSQEPASTVGCRKRSRDMILRSAVDQILVHLLNGDRQ